MWVQLLRGESRVRERAVPVVRVVRAGAVRAALVTTSMWQRGGWGAPENNPHGFVATARIVRRCLDSTGDRVDLPPHYGR